MFASVLMLAVVIDSMPDVFAVLVTSDLMHGAYEKLKKKILLVLLLLDMLDQVHFE